MAILPPLKADITFSINLDLDHGFIPEHVE